MNDDVRALLTPPAFPRSNAYDPAWVLDNNMGPHPLWLMEWLCERVELRPGMRVLDLGCGKALTSIFLAKEYRARVWAADWWIGPDNNWKRVIEAGVEDLVTPLRAEAHALPFAQGFFDAVVSVDAYQYFGTDDLYLGNLASFVRPGGPIGVVVPGLTAPFDEVPAHLLAPQANGQVFWEDDCACFHPAAWWEAMWSRSECVVSPIAETHTAGWKLWRDFERALEETGKGLFPSDAEALERDQGRHLGFVRIAATRSEAPSMNLYAPALGARFGIDV